MSIKHTAIRGKPATADEDPKPNVFYKWVVEIEVNETWVADGFDLTRDRLKDILEDVLGYSYSTETKCRIIAAPDPKAIRHAQGYREESKV